jgi:predicted DCC family thiol-disulfide oxidoreductase YuxK
MSSTSASTPAGSGTPALTVLFDADCGICTQTARLLRTLDGAGRLALVSLQSAPALVPDAPPIAELRRSLHVRSAGGRWLKGGAAVLRIASLVPVLRPIAILGSLPLARPLVDAAYDLVAANRHRVSRLVRAHVCRMPPGPLPRRD